MSSAPNLAKSQIWQQSVDEEFNDPVDSACVGVGQNLQPENVLHLATDLGFSHVCQKEGHAFDKEMSTAEMLVGNADAFIEFPIASVFSPNDLNAGSERSRLCVEHLFNSSHQKRVVIEDMTKAAQDKALSQTIIDDIVVVTDELFTNAMFNAPFVDINTQKNPGINRHTDEVKYADGKVGRIFMAQDENRLLIGCHDPYGTLDLKRYLNKIKATYVRGPAATMNFGPGGAGIGSYIIFNAGASLYFGVCPGRATVLACIIPLGMSNRKRMQLPKHLHWFQR